MQLKRGIRRELYGFRREQPGSLVMSVSPVDATPPVDHHVWPKLADDADHILQDLVAPNSLRLLGSFRKTEILGARKVESYAVAPGRREQFLRAYESELRRLFGTKVVLSAFAAGQGEQCDVCMKPASQRRQHRRTFTVGMSRYIKDPRR